MSKLWAVRELFQAKLVGRERASRGASTLAMALVLSWIGPLGEMVELSVMTVSGPPAGKLLDVGLGNEEIPGAGAWAGAGWRAAERSLPEAVLNGFWVGRLGLSGRVQAYSSVKARSQIVDRMLDAPADPALALRVAENGRAFSRDLRAMRSARDIWR